MGVATVFAIVKVTSETLSTLPLNLVRKSADGKESHPVFDHPLFELIDCAPNDFMSPVDWLATVEGHRTLRGNGFTQIARHADGTIAELIPLHNTQVRYQFDTRAQRPRYWVDREEIPYEDMLHVKGYSENGLVGVNPTSHLRDVIGLAIALQDNASKFFANGSRVADILSTDADLKVQQINQLESRLQRRKELGEEHSTLILDNGLKYVRLRSENHDSQMMEARKLQREEIAGAFGIPLSKVGILDHATFSNIEQLGIDFVVSYLNPIAVRWEKQMNLRLLSKRDRLDGLRLEFDLTSLMRGDADARQKYYHGAILDGWLTRNEVRKREGLNPIDGLDEPLVPLNMLILDSLGRPVNPVPETNGFHPLKPGPTADRLQIPTPQKNGNRRTFKTTA